MNKCSWRLVNFNSPLYFAHHCLKKYFSFSYLYQAGKLYQKQLCKYLCSRYIHTSSQSSQYNPLLITQNLYWICIRGHTKINKKNWMNGDNNVQKIFSMYYEENLHMLLNFIRPAADIFHLWVKVLPDKKLCSLLLWENFLWIKHRSRSHKKSIDWYSACLKMSSVGKELKIITFIDEYWLNS
jgi:hypothetical protein